MRGDIGQIPAESFESGSGQSRRLEARLSRTERTSRERRSMKTTLVAILFLVAGLAAAKDSTPPTLKSVLLEQLKTTHNVQDWFVPAFQSVQGLTPEQANWKDGKGNHSIAQLVNHLTFWDKQQLAKFKGEAAPAYSGNNDETFSGV